MYAREIAVELDLADRGLVSRDENQKGRRVFRITPLAESNYFAPEASDKLDVGEE
jgi:hypothetical protein